MRNANELDKFYPDVNVAFLLKHPWMGEFKVHIKGSATYSGMTHPLFVEDMRGYPHVVEWDWLHPVPRKEGSKPKAKRKPQKGSKPWLAKFEYVDYDPKLIAHGVKVKCRDKKVRVVAVIEHFDDSGHVIDFSDGQTAFLHSGKANYGDRPWCSDIMKILVEKSVENLDTPSRKVYDCPPCHLKFENDKYCGYTPNVWHFWQGKSSTPPVDGDVRVEVWLREYRMAAGNVAVAYNYLWLWNGAYKYDIIAFRIIG